MVRKGMKAYIVLFEADQKVALQDPKPANQISVP